MLNEIRHVFYEGRRIFPELFNCQFNEFLRFIYFKSFNLILFCNSFKNLEDAVGRIKESHLALQCVEADWIGDYWGKNSQDNKVLLPVYGIKIIGVPAHDALDLPDWKEPL